MKPKYAVYTRDPKLGSEYVYVIETWTTPPVHVKSGFYENYGDLIEYLDKHWQPYHVLGTRRGDLPKVEVGQIRAVEPGWPKCTEWRVDQVDLNRALLVPYRLAHGLSYANSGWAPFSDVEKLMLIHEGASQGGGNYAASGPPSRTDSKRKYRVAQRMRWNEVQSWCEWFVYDEQGQVIHTGEDKNWQTARKWLTKHYGELGNWWQIGLDDHQFGKPICVLGGYNAAKTAASLRDFNNPFERTAMKYEAMFTQEAPSQKVQTNHRGDVINLDGKIFFYWHDEGRWQWQIFNGRRAIEIGDCSEWKQVREFAKARGLTDSQYNVRPEEFFDKKTEPAKYEQRLSRQGAIEVTRTYLDQQNDFWDGPSYWSGANYEAELDKLLAPLGMDDRIKLLGVIREELTPKSVPAKRLSVNHARIGTMMFAMQILTLVPAMAFQSTPLSIVSLIFMGLLWINSIVWIVRSRFS